MSIKLITRNEGVCDGCGFIMRLGDDTSITDVHRSMKERGWKIEGHPKYGHLCPKCQKDK